MNIEDVLKFELEITSLCNAKCPNCVRTLFPNNYTEESMSLDDIKSIFPSEKYIKGKLFSLVGQIGDPMMNPDALDIIKYIVSNNGYILINTNGGLRSKKYWQELGALSKETNNIQTWFCVDGYYETNAIYRVNTSYDTIMRNLTAYVEAGGDAKWALITFDHNEHERELCLTKAKELGVEVFYRTPSSDNGEFIPVEDDLQIAIDVYDASSVVCKVTDGNEFHISYDMKVVPCCYTYGKSIANPEIYKIAFQGYEENWNSLKHHTLDEIMKHPYYTKELKDSFNKEHPRRMANCRGCQHNHEHYNNSLRK